ncbi:MAG TPA: OpgC domain-containing protein [Terracidiphilus sp.]|jgi:peptidoglycan/LPS O-acetylase OafA/YrhL
MSIGTQIRFTNASTGGPDTPVAPESPKSQRIPALDFTKGALVLIMVVYHWINYFIDPEWKYLFYLRFLTPSFIFISGFMISHVYLSKYSAADARLSRRLITRGLKLFAIFVVLNLARDVIAPSSGAGKAALGMVSAKILVMFFIFGNLPAEGPKLVSFSILVPISYLLVASGALMPLYRSYRYVFHIACFGLLLASLIFGYAGARNFNLEFVAIGMLGVLVGFAPIEAIESVRRHPYVLTLAYLSYLIAITIWNVPFLLLIVAVFLNLCILYLVGASGNSASAARNEVILLGKYSLLGYIAQVAILQLLSKGFQHINLGATRWLGSFAAAVILTILTVEAVDRVRARSNSADRLYRAVFA